MSEDPSRPKDEDQGEPIMLAVPLYPDTVERIDEEIELRNEETSSEHSREEFVLHAVLDQLDRLEGERWHGNQGSDR